MTLTKKTALAHLSFVLWVGSCTTTAEKSIPPPNPEEDAVTLLTASRDARHRLDAEYKVRLPGVFGAMGSVDALLLADRPDRIRFELKSFFAQPLQIVASDGNEITVFDGLSPSGPKFRKAPATKATLTSLLPIALSPEEIVHVCLGAILPFDSVEAVEKTAEMTKITTRRFDGSFVHTDVTTGTDRIARIEICDSKNVCNVSIDMEDWEIADGDQIALPQVIRISVESKSGAQEISLQATRTRMNGDAFSSAVFRVALPAGQEFEAL